MSTISSTHRSPRQRAAGTTPRTASAAAPRHVFHLCSLALIVIVLYPAVWMLMSSFKPCSEIVGNVSLIPTDFTLANFQKAIEGIGGVSFWSSS